jgi:CRISPR-associated exonuclease Cas4
MGTEVTDADLLPVSALNHMLFCDRRAALIHLEGIYVHNEYTLEGVIGHRRADQRFQSHVEAGIRQSHGMQLICCRLRLIGKADVVEFHARPEGGETPYPVEYKRGKRRRWDNDDVQLCAQALCLEDLLGVPVPAGAIFHIKSKRRREVAFTAELRAKTEDAARRLHELVRRGVTPPPVLKPRCRGCSLRELCLPELLPDKGRLREYQRELYEGR